MKNPAKLTPSKGASLHQEGLRDKLPEIKITSFSPLKPCIADDATKRALKLKRMKKYYSNLQHVALGEEAWKGVIQGTASNESLPNENNL